MIKTVTKKELSVRAKTLATIVALASAVLLPQICHIIGRMAGVGTGLGELLLPMHLPILLVGLMAGPLAGCVSGALAPVISFALTGMPAFTVLPFMVIELAVYGLACGLTVKIKLPVILKVVIAQISGRIVRGVAVILSYYLFSGSIAPVSIINGLKSGAVGILIQLAVIPAVIYMVEHADKKH